MFLGCRNEMTTPLRREIHSRELEIESGLQESTTPTRTPHKNALQPPARNYFHHLALAVYSQLLLSLISVEYCNSPLTEQQVFPRWCLFPVA